MKTYQTFNAKEILHLTDMIIMSYLNDELILVVVHGKQGYGKSTYGSIVLAQVYGVINKLEKYIDEHPELIEGKTLSEIKQTKIKVYNSFLRDNEEFAYKWTDTKNYFVFTPRQFLILSRKQTKKAPGCCIDDAGLWLNAMDYHNPLVKAVGKFMEVGRTKWGVIMFTCSDLQQIFSKIRNMPHVYTVRIVKSEHERNQKRRYARIYKGWVSEDLKKTGRKNKSIDIYYAHMPNTFYDWYQPERAKLADTGLTEIEDELDRLGI
jgi:hypothetical protein